MNEDQLTLWSGERLAKVSALLDFGEVLKTRVEISCSHMDLLRIILDLGGSYGKTSPEYCPQTEDGISVPSSGCWRNSGMGSPTGFLTLNTSEWNHTGEPCLRDDGVSSLSDILETGDVPRRYYLSPKACRGILRRAEKRGKTLPPLLERSLRMVAEQPDPRGTATS